MLFEITFYRENHDAVKERIPKLNKALFDQYLLCLSLASNIKHFYNDNEIKDGEDCSTLGKVQKWARDKGK